MIQLIEAEHTPAREYGHQPPESVAAHHQILGVYHQVRLATTSLGVGC